MFGEELSSRSTWDSASKACLTQGATLVSVPNHIVQGKACVQRSYGTYGPLVALACIIKKRLTLSFLLLFFPPNTAFLVTLLPNSSFHVWVGLTSESQAQFRWFEPGLLSYTNWAPGEPVDNKQNKSPVLL